jgi:hypothetical protein
LKDGKSRSGVPAMKRRRKEPNQFGPANEDPSAPIFVELARLRSQHHLRDAAVILTDVTPYLPLQDRSAYEAIVGEVSVLAQRLNDLKADILPTRQARYRRGRGKGGLIEGVSAEQAGSRTPPDLALGPP